MSVSIPVPNTHCSILEAVKMDLIALSNHCHRTGYVYMLNTQCLSEGRYSPVWICQIKNTKTVHKVLPDLRIWMYLYSARQRGNK